MVDIGDTTDDTFIWSEELEQLGHRIARDCDEAFQSSLLLSESSHLGADSRETSPFMISLGSLPAVRLSDRPASASGARPWDNRPLPPVPSHSTVSPLSIRNHTSNVEGSYKPHSRKDVPIPERRVVSEPAYERPSKDARQLPSIYENTADDWLRRDGGRQDIAAGSLETPTRAKNKGLDFLAKAENTIRVVKSPSAIGVSGAPVEVPEPLNVRKVSQNTGDAKPSLATSVHDSSRHTSYGSNQSTSATNGNGTDAVPSKRRVSSWFKRASKENASGSSVVTATNSSVRSKETSAGSDATHITRPTSQSNNEPSIPRIQKKRSFGFPFWKGSKEELKMSLAGEYNHLMVQPKINLHLLTGKMVSDSDPDGARTRNEKLTKKRHSKESRIVNGTAHSVWSESDGGIRKIEVQQNWLARLFRVKPAMRHLCFTIPKRRARQEVAILLREWRKYGIKDVEVDKGRNIIFARVGPKNCKSPRGAYHKLTQLTASVYGQTSTSRRCRSPSS
jgi:hypothetical protein